MGLPYGRLGRVAEHREQLALDLLAHHVLPAARLFVHVLPLELDHVAEQALRESVLAHDVDGLAPAVAGELEVAVARDDHEAVALHAPDGLRHSGTGVAEALRDARTKRNDVVLFEFEDGAEVHLRRIDQIGHRHLHLSAQNSGVNNAIEPTGWA